MKKPAPVRALLYSGDLLAVDLGTFSVKLLALKARERSLTVLASATKEVWRELANARTDAEKAEVHARALSELLEGNRFKPRNASISLSGNVVLLRFLALPPGYVADPDAGLPSEARALIPFEDPDAIVAALALAPAKGEGARAEMMLAMAERKTVLSGMDVVRKAGLRPAVIINDVLALAGAHEFFEGRKNETFVLVGVGATSTGICVLENGTPRAARVVNIAGGAFTRAVKREFEVDLEEAERLKIAHGLAGAAGDETAEKVARALRPSVKDLAAEIMRTLDVFLERRPADYRPIRRLVLAGGGAALKGLDEALASETGLEASLFRPIVNTAAADGSLGIVPLAGALAVPCGLALSNVMLRRSEQPRVNLVPRRARRSAIIRDVSPGFWRLIAGPAVAVAVLCLYAVWAVDVSKHETAMEQGLEAAAKKERELQRKFTKKKAPVVVKRVENPYSYLAGLTISGVFGDARNSLVMLNGGSRVFVARGGRLYDGNEEVVVGVTTEIRNNSLSLAAGGRTYVIQLPK